MTSDFEFYVFRTLFAQIDHCMTGFGKRLLRKWLVRPLRRAESILERQDAIAELKILVLPHC